MWSADKVDGELVAADKPACREPPPQMPEVTCLDVCRGSGGHLAAQCCGGSHGGAT